MPCGAGAIHLFHANMVNQLFSLDVIAPCVSMADGRRTATNASKMSTMPSRLALGQLKDSLQQLRRMVLPVDGLADAQQKSNLICWRLVANH